MESRIHRATALEKGLVELLEIILVSPYTGWRETFAASGLAAKLPIETHAKLVPDADMVRAVG